MVILIVNVGTFIFRWVRVVDSRCLDCRWNEKIFLKGLDNLKDSEDYIFGRLVGERFTELVRRSSRF